MNIIQCIIITSFFVGYLWIFFKILYPKRELSRGNKYFPFGMVVISTGFVYGAIIYFEVILHSSLTLDAYLITTYPFIIILALLIHFHPMQFPWRSVLYGLCWVTGILAYVILLAYIQTVLWGAGPETTWMLIVGIFFFPLTVLGAWGAVREDIVLQNLNASWRFWRLIGLTLVFYSLFTIIFGAVLILSLLIICGVIQGIVGCILMGIMESRLRS